MKEIFRHFAEKAAHAVGSYWAFLIALLTIVVWASTGPYFNYSDTWQLFINTGTMMGRLDRPGDGRLRKPGQSLFPQKRQR